MNFIPGSVTNHQIYVKSNKKVEKWTKFFYKIVFRGAIPIFILQNVIASAIKYFSSDFSKDALQLPYPAS